jgi:DNA invertase Pin-like site-specific DNA recombinase
MEMIKVGLYDRVSHDEQALYGDSLRTQIEALRKYAKEKNYIIVDEYIDDGYTATQLNRPGLQRLLQDIQDGKIDMILFTKIDRWSRGVRNYYKLQDILDEHNVDWKTIWEEYDTTTAAGRLQINIMLAIAENESNVTSDRIKVVFKNKLERGEVISGSVPLGYRIKDKHLEVVEELRPLVRDIFNNYERLMSLSKLVDYYKDKHQGLTYWRLKRMLENYLYIGMHVSDYGIYRDFCTKIIEPEQFERVQRLLAMNAKHYKKAKSKNEYIFKGVLRCADCGRKLGGNAGRKTYKYPSQMKNTYRCNWHYRDKTCPNNYNITEKMIERRLLEQIKPELEKYLLTIDIKTKEYKSTASIDIGKINKKLEKLRDLYMDDLIDKDHYKTEYERLTKLLQEKEKVEKPRIIDEKSIQQFLSMDIELIYKDLTKAERRRLWLSIIDHVVVNRETFEITFL